MRWQQLLFAHWEVDPGALRPLVPQPLELDLFEGRAFVGVVPFTMSGIRLRGLPEVPGTHSFHELNVRTYVRYQGRPGVWFLSLDANHGLAVRAARRWFHLRYLDCDLRLAQDGEWIAYQAHREDSQIEYEPYPTRGARGADLGARYRAIEPHSPDDLDHFLTARYCLYSYSRAGHVYRGEIDHEPWPLYSAEAEFTKNTMAGGLGIQLQGAPRLLFSPSLDVVAWSPQRLT